MASFHSRPSIRREGALELVHTDVCYVNAPSHHGGQYFVNFIDDYSRKLCQGFCARKPRPGERIQIEVEGC
mgnify:CR=1 FL=1